MRSNKKNRIIKAALIITMVMIPFSIFTQSVEELDRQAQEYYNNKDYSNAISKWMEILDIDPENRDVQKKIEMIYEMKQKKDLELERAKINYKKAKIELNKNKEADISYDDAELNLEKAREKAKRAFDSFITAYRIDPRDPELQPIREEMEKLEKYIASEEKKLSVSKEQRRRAMELAALAQKAMDESRYKDALGYWEEILAFMPENVEALEGKRQATLAIENIIRFENIKKFLQSGIAYFNKEDYKLARQDFMNVLQLDPENNTAQDYIEKIDDKLHDKKKREERDKQAEILYASGVKNLKEYKFDDAVEDFEQILSLYDDKNYRDTKEKLASIPKLREDFERKSREQRLKEIEELFNNGMIALSEGRYQDAISYFEKTLVLDPKNKIIPPYLQRAKDAQKLVEEEVVDENSPYYDVVNSLMVSGKKLYNAGRYAESKKRWEQIVELFPSNLMANEFIMKCEIKMDPDKKEYMVKRFIAEAEKYMNDRDYRNAYRKYTLVKSIDPGYPNIDSLISKSDKTKSLSGSLNLSADETAEIERRYKLGMAYYQKGGEDNLKKALEELRWVVQKDPGYIKAVVIVNKIEAQFRAGSTTEKKTGKKLTAEEEKLVRQYYFNGITYYQNNDIKRAIAEWRKVLLIDPNHTKAKNNIRKAMVILGR